MINTVNTAINFSPLLLTTLYWRLLSADDQPTKLKGLIWIQTNDIHDFFLKKILETIQQKIV